uniref:Lysophosphatidylcholine acyltransferase 4 n=1 Tax=Macaca fascicularis TaxID=9541 RepID=A0A7N9IGL6_MACFA
MRFMTFGFISGVGNNRKTGNKALDAINLLSSCPHWYLHPTLGPSPLFCSHTTCHMQGMMAVCSRVCPLWERDAVEGAYPSSKVAFSRTLCSSSSWGHCWPPSECFWPLSSSFSSGPLPGCKWPVLVRSSFRSQLQDGGTLLRFNQAILVSRHDPASRRRVVEEVRRRATSGGKWPQVLFFPEGTCSNKKALLKFKPGAFIAGVPVQPVLIRYPNSLDTTSWAWRGPGVLQVLWLTASQPCSIVDVEFLPVYHPSPEESRDPTLYANNVQRVMAQALGIPATECEFVGSLPVIVVGRLKVALEPQLWELGKVLRKAGLSPGYVDAGAEPGRSRMISQEEFARQLQLSDPQTVAGAFGYFQQDTKGLVDFRDVALALAALDGGRNLEELTRLAFELFAEEQAEGPHRLLCEAGFSTILHLLLGSPRPAAAALHAELCQAGPSRGLSLCQFQNFSLHDPLYGKLFSTYLRPPHTSRGTSQTANASSPGSPTALANGTVQAPKQKGD